MGGWERPKAEASEKAAVIVNEILSTPQKDDLRGVYTIRQQDVASPADPVSGLATQWIAVVPLRSFQPT